MSASCDTEAEERVVVAELTPHLSFESQNLKHLPDVLLLGDATTAPSISATFTHVVSLNLSRNFLRELPDSIGRLTSLTSLNVSRNSLRSLPSALGNLSKLTSLNALSNSLRPSTIPTEQLASLEHLTEFDLRFNEKCKGQASLQELIKALGARVNVQFTVPKKPTPASEIQHACDRDATLLRSQLEPWSTPTLRKRLLTYFEEDSDPERHDREYVMDRLLHHYDARGPRRQLQFTGIPVGEDTVKALLKELHAWTERVQGKPRERETINAQVW
jgi:hypothetical protein